MSEDVSISINEVSHPILCGTCQRRVAFIGEANVESGQAGCVPCVNIADVQEVAKIAVEYAKDEAKLILNRAARDVAKTSKIMNFSGQTEHDQSYRFVVDLKL